MKHNENKVLRSLAQKRDIKIENKNIFVLTFQQDLGNKSWGKIDFLTNYCNYCMQFIYKF